MYYNSGMTAASEGGYKEIGSRNQAQIEIGDNRTIREVVQGRRPKLESADRMYHC